MEDTYLCPAFTEAHARVLKTQFLQYAASRTYDMPNSYIEVSPAKLADKAGITKLVKNASLEDSKYGEIMVAPPSSKFKIDGVRFKLSPSGDTLGLYISMATLPENGALGLFYDHNKAEYDLRAIINLTSDYLKHEFDGRMSSDEKNEIKSPQPVESFLEDMGLTKDMALDVLCFDIEGGNPWITGAQLAHDMSMILQDMATHDKKTPGRSRLLETGVGKKLKDFFGRQGKVGTFGGVRLTIPKDSIFHRFMSETGLPWISKEWMPAGVIRFKGKNGDKWDFKNVSTDWEETWGYSSHGPRDMITCKLFASKWADDLKTWVLRMGPTPSKDMLDELMG